MRSFFKTVLAVIVGMSIMMIFPIIFFIIIFGAIAAFNSGNNKSTHEKIEKNTILSIDLSLPITESYNQQSFDLTHLSEFKMPRYTIFQDLLKTINHAKHDDNIKGISLKLKNTNADYAQAKSIRDALKSFKTSGKFIYAFGDVLSQKDYYIGSVSDSLFISPLSYIELAGINAQVTFYKRLLDKVGIEFDIIKHGKYKSAVEPYFLDKMSSANKEQTQMLIDDIWSNLSEEISQSRSLSKEQFNLLTDSLKGFVDQDAVYSGLIDGIKYNDDYQKLLDKKGRETISISDYLYTTKTSFQHNKIAIIYATGEIKSGNGTQGIQDQKIIEEIKKAKENPSVKAAVLRINSPGGDAAASERILHELNLLRQEKPLIVSFGGTAASGGYYISTAADTIVSSPNTITGSIGVFGVIPNIKKLAERIGITTEVVSTHTNPKTMPLLTGITPAYRKVIRRNIEEIYGRFLSHVAKNRKMSKDAVDSIGQGRIWSGISAKKIGLVDVLGDLNTAISIAAKKAKIKQYDILALPRKKTEWELLSETIFGNDKMNFKSLVKETLGDEIYQTYKTIHDLKDKNMIQAKLPYSLKLK